MRSMTKHLSITVSIITFLVVADQVTKILARMYLKGAEEISFLGDFFVLTYAENRGAFLSMGNMLPEQAWAIVMTVIPTIFIGGLLVYLIRHRELSLTETIIFSGIVAGGIGNLIDRYAFGFVTDFINFGIGDIRTGILNIADIPITMGIIYLMIYYTVNDFKKKKKPDSDESAAQ